MESFHLMEISVTALQRLAFVESMEVYMTKVLVMASLETTLLLTWHAIQMGQ